MLGRDLNDRGFNENGVYEDFDKLNKEKGQKRHPHWRLAGLVPSTTVCDLSHRISSEFYVSLYEQLANSYGFSVEWFNLSSIPSFLKKITTLSVFELGNNHSYIFSQDDFDLMARDTFRAIPTKGKLNATLSFRVKTLLWLIANRSYSNLRYEDSSENRSLGACFDGNFEDTSITTARNPRFDIVSSGDRYTRPLSPVSKKFRNATRTIEIDKNKKVANTNELRFLRSYLHSKELDKLTNLNDYEINKADKLYHTTGGTLLKKRRPQKRSKLIKQIAWNKRKAEEKEKFENGDRAIRLKKRKLKVLQEKQKSETSLKKRRQDKTL